MCSTVQIRRYSDEFNLVPEKSDPDSINFEQVIAQAQASGKAQLKRSSSQIFQNLEGTAYNQFNFWN